MTAALFVWIKCVKRVRGYAFDVLVVVGVNTNNYPGE